MYKNGHIGLALLFAAPFALLFGLLFGPHWAVLTLAFSFTTARVPDMDQRLNILTHRGFTHTVWFALLVSVVMGSLVTQLISILDFNTVGNGEFLSWLIADIPTLVLASFGFMLGFMSHLFGDILTEAYDYTINPYWPVSKKHYTLGWATADSRIWNWGLFLSGIISATAVLFLIALGI